MVEEQTTLSVNIAGLWKGLVYRKQEDDRPALLERDSYSKITRHRVEASTIGVEPFLRLPNKEVGKLSFTQIQNSLLISVTDIENRLNEL